MTSRTIENTTTTVRAEVFPDYPPRDDMQNFIYLSLPSHMTSLRRFYSHLTGVSVLSEVPVSQRYGDYSRVRIPDLMVCFDSDLDLALEHNGYAVDRQGGSPNFVLEIASVSTARRDEDEKRRDYESFGVSEYWRFDPTGGERYEAALAGDRLLDGGYQPLEVEWTDEERCRGWSQALGLYVCWERGQLRFFDPASQEYLRTHDDEADRADAEAALRERETALRERAEAEVARLRARLRELGADDV